MKVLVTGAGGFIGRALCKAVLARGDEVLGLVRSETSSLPGLQSINVPLENTPQLANFLNGVECVVHLAGRAHKLADNVADPLAEFRAVNCNATLELVRQAVAAGVKRFIFISSIGVNGNNNVRPFTASDQPNPAEPYALSKWEAEQGLWQVQEETGIELVIIRPPLVYGAHAPGNFGSLSRWVCKGVPLPLGAIHNKRSLVGIDNLVDLIIRCIDHPDAANQVFLAGDGEDLSTTELLRGVGRAMGKPARLIPVPAGLLQFGATLLGRKAMAQRLLGSLQVDISKTCELLDWKPPYTVEEGLRRCFERSN
ncbi:SDR family oxidoreductase [Pseudomonas sp. 9Ag]|uniref:UDP-glucose 4-epimerase family protein n=1 Tax=Pseudomonas sp. 9Ag TaxID=2653167 RepID=UPI0012EF0216|nr:SDR family oxidoreductase [Pseudomonas sp. 9Ag]VXC80931.1 UDP-glucose 4-epimerase [Pseudomonas sp. 9Ag]